MQTIWGGNGTSRYHPGSPSVPNVVYFNWLQPPRPDDDGSAGVHEPRQPAPVAPPTTTALDA